jgi:hypothetical protein
LATHKAAFPDVEALSAARQRRWKALQLLQVQDNVENANILDGEANADRQAA